MARHWLAEIIWDLEDEPDGNAYHIAENGVTMEEVEDILRNRRNPTDISLSSGRPITSGYTKGGRFLIVVWEEACDNPRMIRPITAYEPDPL